MDIHGRREFLRRAASCALGVPALGRGFAQSARPLNFVFILIDDLGWRDVGCFGSQYYETPNVNRLAASGMKFTSFYAAAPVCSPTTRTTISRPLSRAAPSAGEISSSSSFTRIAAWKCTT